MKEWSRKCDIRCIEAFTTIASAIRRSITDVQMKSFMVASGQPRQLIETTNPLSEES